MEALPGPDEQVLRHVTGGHLTEVVDESNATVWSQTRVYTGPLTAMPSPVAGPAMVVEYRDRLVRHSETWLIARRDTTIVFPAAPARHDEHAD